MRKTTILTAAVAALGLLAAAPAAVTQARGGVSGQPVMIGADGGEMSETGFALRGRAEVIQGDNRLRADAIEGRSANGQVTQVTASGDVYYVTPNETIRGDRAAYDVNAATIVVTGDVILTQGRNVLTGARLTYNVDTGVSTMSGGSGGRLQGVFYPQGD